MLLYFFFLLSGVQAHIFFLLTSFLLFVSLGCCLSYAHLPFSFYPWNICSFVRSPVRSLCFFHFHHIKRYQHYSFSLSFCHRLRKSDDDVDWHLLLFEQRRLCAYCCNQIRHFEWTMRREVEIYCMHFILSRFLWMWLWVCECVCVCIFVFFS